MLKEAMTAQEIVFPKCRDRMSLLLAMASGILLAFEVRFNNCGNSVSFFIREVGT